MKILSLSAENVKRLTVVEITPQGNLVQITGPNGSGKTSVLDSIMYALQGASTVPTMPIRKGQTSATIRLDLGELIVTRKFTKSGSTLTVENASGLTHKTPQAVLDRLMGSIAFDPLAFSRQKPREQFDTLRGLVKLDIDLEAIDGANDRDYRERADLNKSAKMQHANLESMPAIPVDLPETPIDTGALVDEIAAAGKHNADIEKEHSRRATELKRVPAFMASAEKCRKQAAELRQQAESFDRQADHCDTQAAEIEATLKALPVVGPHIDPSEVRKRLTEAEAVNKNIERREALAHLRKQAEKVEKQAAELTERMNAREQAKREAIAAAQMPIEGIGFGDGLVLLNDVPFDQASDAEQLRASCAIAMAANPKLRVLRIRDGSLLDENGLKLLAEMADANDYQCWIEIVSDGKGKVGVIMEDGHVKQRATEEALTPAAASV